MKIGPKDCVLIKVLETILFPNSHPEMMGLPSWTTTTNHSYFLWQPPLSPASAKSTQSISSKPRNLATNTYYYWSSIHNFSSEPRTPAATTTRRSCCSSQIHHSLLPRPPHYHWQTCFLLLFHNLSLYIQRARFSLYWSESLILSETILNMLLSEFGLVCLPSWRWSLRFFLYSGLRQLNLLFFWNILSILMVS